MQNLISTPQDFEFHNNLEYAMIRALVVEVTLKASADTWKKCFIKEIIWHGKNSQILTKKEESISFDQIEKVRFPFDAADAESISCLCV